MRNNSLNYKLEITRDGMEAYITLIDEKRFLEESNEISIGKEKEIKRIIEEIKSKIQIGLMEDVLISILYNKIYDEKFLIAEGIQPIAGKDGYVKFHFDLDKKLIPKVYDDGTVDYRELDIVNNVKKGDILAELIPAEEGKDGLKINGEAIRYKPGKPPYIRYGKNVEPSEDGDFLISSTNGLVKLDGNRIIVSEVFEVQNVNNQTGNIYFNGAVLVRENALNGFQIKADGDVEVHGVVEGAYIENGGNLIIRRGVQGYNRETIKTKGNITTKFVENAIIHADGNIVAEAIIHSQISCRKNINLIGKRGLIVGGVCRAGLEISAKTIGSSMATSTTLEVGVDPEALKKREQLESDIGVAEDNLDKITKSLILLENLKKANRLDQEKTQMYLRLISTRDTLLQELQIKRKEYEELEKSTENYSRGIVKVSGTIYPGVKIIIGNSTYFVRDEMEKCRFYREEGEIKIGHY
ncbi:MAG: DUF342 domain-containing protein [Tissierellia bacterium]|nr:DUF342 domain-containing protein [Tissierellia bacterium]